MRGFRWSEIPNGGARGRRRGSALLMVVGLLVILAMLGTTFLLVCRLDAREARALAQKSAADPLAGGILQQTKAILKEDLWIQGTNGPYADTGDGTRGWARFIDYPSEEVDEWLASYECNTFTDTIQQIITWKHVSNLGSFAITATPDVSFRRTWLTVEERWSDWSSDKSSDEPVDTDGDGWPDALFYDTGVKNEDGETYHAAVRIIDLSGLLNVNTAGKKGSPDLPSITSPVHVDLMTDILSGYYNLLHAERCRYATSEDQLKLKEFYAKCASRLLDPEDGYLPFAIGDEIHLRWAEDDSSLLRVGRLYEATKNTETAAPFPAFYRRFLTTWNCSRILPRNPSNPDFTQALVLHNPNDPTGDTNFLGNPDHRQAVYDRMKLMLTELGLGNTDDDRKRMAAHFVANLWVYMTPLDDLSAWPWEFSPEGTFTVYGVIEQPVISEVYAKHVPESDDDVGDNKWFAAVEIFNPYDHSLNFPGLQYKVGGDPILAPDPGQHDVYYNTFQYPLSEIETDTGIEQTLIESWQLRDGIKFFEGNTVTLTCEVGSTAVVIDEVSSTDIEHDADGPKALPEVDNAQRDDRTAPDYARYNAASYVLTNDSTGPHPDTTHTLGADNNIPADPDKPELVSYPVPIIHKGGAVSDLGEFARIYLTGHYEYGGVRTPFTKNLLDSINPGISSIFDDGPSRGRLDLKPSTIALDSFSPGTYPDIPASGMIHEFFTLIPGDSTREPPERTYGRVNVNTAPRAVLEALPWEKAGTFNKTEVVDYVLAYRDMEDGTGLPNYGSAGREGASNVTGLRRDSRFSGFLAPGEVAIPLGDFFNNEVLGWDGGAPPPDPVKYKDYLSLRDSLYRAVSNLITVNSDVFAVNMRIQLREDLTGKVKGDWYYVAVIDRSNCRTGSDRPAVLLFSQIE